MYWILCLCVRVCVHVLNVARQIVYANWDTSPVI